MGMMGCLCVLEWVLPFLSVLPTMFSPHLSVLPVLYCLDYVSICVFVVSVPAGRGRRRGGRGGKRLPAAAVE